MKQVISLTQRLCMLQVKDKPVRASAEDAQYFVKWIDNILANIKQEGPWNQYFTHDLDVVQKRYEKARDVYKTIALEASREKIRQKTKVRGSGSPPGGAAL